MLRSADAILMAYVEAREKLSSAQAIGYTLHSGLVTSLLCGATRTCGGYPRPANEHDQRQGREGWICSSCNKPWQLEAVELGRTQIGGRVSMWGKTRRVARGRTAARSPDTAAHRALRDYGPVLHQVHEEDQHAFIAWALHLLDDAGIQAGIEKSLGAAQHEIPARMLELVRAERLAPLYGDVTEYRVRRWIRWARRRTLQIIEDRTRATIAMAAAI
jgi:hypothetical protein